MLAIREKHRDLSDEDLLKLFGEKGDLDILGALYSRHMHLVYGVALKYFASKDEAKDAVMQIFEKLIHEAGRHRVENFKSWLYVLTKNHCLMEIRSQKSKDRKLEGWKNEQEFMESDTEVHPIDEDGESMDARLAACIEGLKNEQQRCIRLFYYEKKCYKEISDELGLEEKKVKSHLQNAKRNLKICLEQSNVG